MEHFEKSALLPAADRAPAELATSLHIPPGGLELFSLTPPCTYISFCSWPAWLYLSWNQWLPEASPRAAYFWTRVCLRPCLDIVKSGSFAQKGQRERPEQRDLSSWPLTRLGKAPAPPGAGSFRLWGQDCSGWWKKLPAWFPEG